MRPEEMEFRVHETLNHSWYLRIHLGLFDEKLLQVVHVELEDEDCVRAEVLHLGDELLVGQHGLQPARVQDPELERGGGGRGGEHRDDPRGEGEHHVAQQPHQAPGLLRAAEGRVDHLLEGDCEGHGLGGGEGEGRGAAAGGQVVVQDGGRGGGRPSQGGVRPGGGGGQQRSRPGEIFVSLNDEG